MLQILLGPERPAPPGDFLGRTMLGWRPGMSESEAWEAGRGVWKFKTDRALAQDEVQIVNTEGLVLVVARITGVTKHADRYALEGVVLHGDPRVGKPTPSPHLSRNPVGYIDDQYRGGAR